MDRNSGKYSLKGLGELGQFLPLPRDRMKYAEVGPRCSSNWFFKTLVDEVSAASLNNSFRDRSIAALPLPEEVTKVNK